MIFLLRTLIKPQPDVERPKSRGLYTFVAIILVLCILATLYVVAALIAPAPDPILR